MSEMLYCITWRRDQTALVPEAGVIPSHGFWVLTYTVLSQKES